MLPDRPVPGLRFLFDQHVSVPALFALRERGTDVLHVREAGLAAADDVDVLRFAMAHDRIVVTRNYRDFVPLARALGARGDDFPGVLLLATSLPQGDAGAHVRAIEAWTAEVEARGADPVRGGWGRAG